VWIVVIADEEFPLTNLVETLRKLKAVVEDPDIWINLERILITGVPALCNAEATEENFQAYRTYSNHTSVRDKSEEYEKTIVKQSKRGLTLIMEPNLIHFAVNVHVTPQGIVYLMHPRRKPRPCFGTLPYPFGHIRSFPLEYLSFNPSTWRLQTRSFFNITTALVKITIRSVAAQVYNLDSIKNCRELQLWSSHSIRAGACAILYAKGFIEIEIKFLLRWKSNAFMT
jgi:hypothetical protein